MLDVCYHITQLLLHRQFMQVPTVELDSAMEELISHSHTICTQAAANINTLSKEAELHRFISVSPTALIYAVFQGALIHMYNINNDNMKTLSQFNLQRSMNFLVERRKWSAVSRVIEILKLMATLNGIKDETFLSTPEAEPAESSQATESSFTSSSKRRRRTRTTSDSASKKDPVVISKMEASTEGELYEESVRPTSIPAYLPFNYDLVGDEVPKGQWIQRMMSTSVVGGITPDIQPSLGSMFSMTHHMQRGPPHMEDLERHPTNMPSPLPDTSVRPPVPTQYHDSALIPWHHLQMLSQQSYTPYPMYATSNAHPGGGMHSTHPGMYGDQHSYSVPVNQGISSKPEFAQRSQPGVQTSMFQHHNPALAGSLPRMRQDLNTLLPPGSLNWEDWNSYVDQETNRHQ
jgi:hypothetical protein